MKRIISLLLCVLIVFSLCACSDKKEEEQKKTEAPKVTEKKTEEAKAPENVIAEPSTDGNSAPTEIGPLPIIFEDGSNQSSEGTETTPPANQDTPPTTTSKNPILGNSDGTVVETPIIPFK